MHSYIVCNLPVGSRWSRPRTPRLCQFSEQLSFHLPGLVHVAVPRGQCSAQHRHELRPTHPERDQQIFRARPTERRPPDGKRDHCAVGGAQCSGLLQEAADTEGPS
ncbi:hypothetical protein RHCRD62_60284 [Rhodococcus sp. RD6.2]|nr:hypothetical protein RHCRD62_60284 [Rhodococcus sp. RD6.2]